MRTSIAFLTAITCAVVGCGQSASTPAKDKPGVSPVATTASVSKPDDGPSLPAPGDPPDTGPEAGTPIPGPAGRIEGTITFVGVEIPKATVVQNGTDPQICGAQISKRDVEISPETRGIRYVLVWLEGVKLPEGYKAPQQNLILDNLHCQFEPHAAVITVGSVIETRNSDEVYHTTNLFGKLTKENIPLISKGATHRTKVRIPELIGVKCDKHGWMQAFIRVDPHPFHTVTDADGKFAIADVPVGTYKLKAWHEMFYGQEIEVIVKDNETASVELKYPAAEQK